MLKVDIIEEVLIPLLKQLDSAKDRALKENDDIEKRNMFQKIVRDIDAIKEVLLVSRKRETEVMDMFGSVCRNVDNMLDSGTNQTETELQNIETQITSIKETLIPQPSSDIIEEVLIPLLKQLDSAKDRALKENDDIEKRNMFQKIVRDIDAIKDVLLKSRKRATELMDKFGSVSRNVDNMFDSGTNQTETELQNIETQITSIKKTLIPQSELLPNTTPSSDQTSKSELGESSKTPDLYSTANYARQSTAMAFSEKIMNMLDPQMRHCMFCLSIFPENSVVKKRLLIYWWISLGLVESTHGKTAEEIGEIILMELIKTGLVIPIYRKHNMVVDRCRLQSHIRKLVISAAEENQFLSMNPDGDAESTFGKNKEKGTLQVFSTKMVQKKVQTLFNIDRKYLKFEEISYQKMRNMAVMQIGRWHFSEEHHHIEVENTEFFKGLGTELKYLSLQGISRITELPDSIGNLTDLIILDLRSCHNLESLTVKLTLLKKLTHLDVSKCYLLDHMPKGLSSLTNLQVLKGFVIGNRRSKDPCRLSDLSRLTKLRKLSINIGRESIITEWDCRKLQEFTALRSLTITWGVHESKDGTEKSQNSAPENRETEPPTSLDQRSAPKSLSCFPRAKPQTSLDQGSPGTDSQILLDQLSPPKSLEKLDIRCFPRAEPPTWLVPTELGSLKRLYIRGGKLAQLGNNDSQEKWKVEVLRLRFLKDFDIEWSELLRVFPELKCAECKECSRLKNFRPTDDGEIWKKEKDDHSQSSSTSKNSGASNTSKKDPMIHS